MKKFNKSVIVIVLAFVLVFGFTLSNTAEAATTPSLGAASTFGVLSSTFTNSNTAPYTIVNGDTGYTVAGAPVTPPLTVTGTPHPEDATWALAGLNQGTALSNLNSQTCTTITGPLNATVIPGNAPGVFPPGCYTMAGALLITLGTSITLDLTGPGAVGNTWIFKSTGGGLTTGADSFVTLANGASACDVFWVPVGAANIGAYTGALPNTTKLFIGTIIDAAGIGLGHFANLSGRALAFGGTVTTDANTITVPTGCVAPVAPVVYGSGPLITAPVPPLISILKVPAPLALPLGPGNVVYGYTVSNVGTVPMSNVTVVDNKCSAVNFVSGDTNNDLKLDVNETWKYSCNTTLSQTTTNTVTASGQANGFTAVDIASATVVVGVPIVPPIIHVVKKPNLFVIPMGGAVTYTYTVTNPGVVSLNNVTLTDDKCSAISNKMGDSNNNQLLDVNEIWTYTCTTHLNQTTTNVGTVKGSANGLTATDFSLATVVVTPPKLPKTGFPPKEEGAPWNIIISAGILGVVLAFYQARKKQII